VLGRRRERRWTAARRAHPGAGARRAAPLLPGDAAGVVAERTYGACTFRTVPASLSSLWPGTPAHLGRPDRRPSPSFRVRAASLGRGARARSGGAPAASCAGRRHPSARARARPSPPHMVFVTITLAPALDSLVRVSRRAVEAGPVPGVSSTARSPQRERRTASRARYRVDGGSHRAPGAPAKGRPPRAAPPPTRAAALARHDTALVTRRVRRRPAAGPTAYCTALRGPHQWRFPQSPVRPLRTACGRQTRAERRSPRGPGRATCATRRQPHLRATDPGRAPIGARGSAARAPPLSERRPRHNPRPTQLPSLQRFPLGNFKHCLTLFSKSFSSFAHATCSLSVSHPYLAFDGIYHRTPLDCNPKQPDSSIAPSYAASSEPQTGLSPSPVPLSSGLWLGSATDDASRNPTTRNARGARPIVTLGSSRFSRPYWGNPG